MLAKNDTLDSVASTVINIITEVLSEQGLLNGTVEESAKLVDTLGLKSMDIAQIVLNLEDELDTDPFQELPITSIRTARSTATASSPTTTNPPSVPSTKSIPRPFT